MRGRAADYEKRYAEARRLVMEEKVPARKAALQCGISRYPFQRRMLREEGLDVRSQLRGNQKPDPTPEEIAERAAEIRASWTVEECSKRWVANHSSIRADRLARTQGAA